MAVIRFSEGQAHNALNPADKSGLPRQGWQAENILYSASINVYTQEALRGAFARLPILVIPNTFSATSFSVPSDNTTVDTNASSQVYYAYEVAKSGLEIVLQTDMDEVNIGQLVSITNVSDGDITVNIGVGTPVMVSSGQSIGVRRLTNSFVVVLNSDAGSGNLTILKVINAIYPVGSLAFTRPLNGKMGVSWNRIEPGEIGALLAMGSTGTGNFNTPVGDYAGSKAETDPITLEHLPAHDHNIYFNTNSAGSGASASLIRPPTDKGMTGVLEGMTDSTGIPSPQGVGLDGVRRFGLPIYKRMS